MNVTLELETDDGAASFTFIVDNIDGENEWAIDYNYIEVSEDGGPNIPRTWKYLTSVYDAGKLAQLKHEAIEYAIDNYDKYSDQPDEELD